MPVPQNIIRKWQQVDYAHAALERARDHLALMLAKLDKLMRPADPNALVGSPPDCQDEADFVQAAWEVYQAQLVCVAAEQLIADTMHDVYQAAETNYADCLAQ